MARYVFLSPSDPNVVSRSQTSSSRNFWDFIILVDSSYNSGENRVLFYKIGARGFWNYGLIIFWALVSYPNVVSRPHNPRSKRFLRFHDFIGLISWFWEKWGPICENWSQGSRLMAWYIFWVQHVLN